MVAVLRATGLAERRAEVCIGRRCIRCIVAAVQEELAGFAIIKLETDRGCADARHVRRYSRA
jgi:hypothetical protein